MLTVSNAIHLIWQKTVEQEKAIGFFSIGKDLRKLRVLHKGGKKHDTQGFNRTIACCAVAFKSCHDWLDGSRRVSSE